MSFKLKGPFWVVDLNYSRLMGDKESERIWVAELGDVGLYHNNGLHLLGRFFGDTERLSVEGCSSSVWSAVDLDSRTC
jgi:hypothetical protein